MTDFEKRSIEGRIILITGASRGIGFDLAKKLAKDKANLILVSRKQEDIDKAVEEIKKETGNENIAGFACDIGKLDSINELFKKISSLYTHIDVLVNNASIMIGYAINPLQIPDELDYEQFRINVDGYYFVTKRALPLLFKAPEGFDRTIINTTSGAGWLANAHPGYGMLGYRMTKTAEMGLTVALHKQYVEDSDMSKQVRGNDKLHRVACVHPGFVATALGKESWGDGNEKMENIIKVKSENLGAISVDKGSDTLYYLITAKDVPSGKSWYERKVVDW